MTNPSIMDRIGPAWRAAAGTDMSRRRFIKLTGASGFALGLLPAAAGPQRRKPLPAS